MFYKDRVQVKNPMTKRWVKLNTATGGIIGHKTDDKPYKNVMTTEQRDKLHPEEKVSLDDVKIKIDPKYAKQKIVCDCGHYAKDHFNKEGWCDKCGCTWYYPNYRWLRKQRIIARAKLVENKT